MQVRVLPASFGDKMRIVDKRRDYYDCIQAHGQDMSLNYIRTEEEVCLTKRTSGCYREGWPFPFVHSRSLFEFDLTQYIVGFCGKIYPVWQLSEHTYAKPLDDRTSTKCFTAADVVAFMKANLKDKEFKQWDKPQHKSWSAFRSKWFGYHSVSSRREVEKFFERCKDQQDEFFSMFEDKRCPVFVAEYNRGGKAFITYNALLRPIEFVRVKDPFTAFQEIAMFMSNFAVPQMPMPELSDAMKIQKRGFTEQSFRAQFNLTKKKQTRRKVNDS